MIEALDFLRSMPIYDHFLVLFFALFAIIGFLRGGAKIIIHSLWFIIGILLATYLYQFIASFVIFGIFTTNKQLLLFINFAVILVLFYLLKIAIYRLLAAIANLHGPCPINRFLAAVIGYGIIIVLSWYIALDVHSTTLISELIANNVVRFALTFVFMIFALLTIGYILMVMLNIKVGIDKPCPLIKALQPLDDILNAKKINTLYNSFGGVLLGLIQAFIIIILALIIINHTSLYNHTIITNAEGLLLVFKNTALDVQIILSKYLTFLNN
jgi:uncharacterized membrane protein required for colicin V production